MIEQEIDVDEEELELDYNEMCDDVVDLKNELKAAKIEAMQLHLRLKAAIAKSPDAAATVMPRMPAVAVKDQRLEDIEKFLMFLAKDVCLDQETELQVGLSVTVANRTAQMQRVVQWPIFMAGSAERPVPRRLELSAPIECAPSLKALLATTKAEGKVDPEQLQIAAATWDLVAGDLETVTQKALEPVAMLAHRSMQLGILVASWPTPAALEAFQAVFSVDGEPFQAGQRVEVEYNGTCFVGTLHSVTANGKAVVHCDVDRPDVLTLSPIHQVRHLRVGQSEVKSNEGSQPVLVEPELVEPPSQPAVAGTHQALRRSQSEGSLEQPEIPRRCNSDGNINSML